MVDSGVIRVWCIVARIDESTKRSLVHGLFLFLAIVTALPIALWLHVMFIRLAIGSCY